MRRGSRNVSATAPTATGAEVMTYREALRLALREELGRDQRVFLIGEEIGVFDGAYKASAGLLEEFGADLSRVIIGHLGDRVGVHHLLPIAAKGVYLEIDNIGYLDYQPEHVRADNVAALVKEGFVDQMLLSEDICMLNHLKYTGGKGYAYLLDVFVPMLRERGVTNEQIRCMMVDNPARAFSRKRPASHE